MHCSQRFCIQQLIINSGFGLSNNKPEDLQKKDTKFLALSTKISYKPKNNKISSYIGFNRVIGENTDINNTINNQKDSYKIGSQYKINDYFSIKYSSDYLIFTDNTNINNNYSEIKGKLTMKITF